MNSSVRSKCRSLLLAVALPVVAGILPQASFSVWQDQVVSAQPPKGKDEKKTKVTGAISQKVYEKLGAAQVEFDAKKYDKALSILAELKAKETSSKDPLKPYEVFQLYNFYGAIYFSQEKYDQSLNAYRKAISQPDMDPRQLLPIRFTIAQLYLVQEKWQQGVDALIEWINATESPNADAYALLAQGYYQLKQYDKALTNIDKSIGMFKASNRQPKENWYNLAAFLWSEKNNYDKVIDILRETLQYYPKKQYWLQLSAMYGEKKKEAVQLAALEAMYVDGKLTEERELVQLASLYLANEIPYLGAKVLDKGMSAGKIEKTEKNLELLGNAWRMAQEVKKSVPVLEQAAAKSAKGEIWARLGNVYLDNEEYDKSAKAIRSALQKGSVKNQDMAYLTLGMAEFNLKKYDAARKAFEQAQKGKQAAPYAAQWLQYLDKELERQKSLETL